MVIEEVRGSSISNRQSRVVIVIITDSQVILLVIVINVGLKYIVGPVERLFSIGGKWFLPERCRHTDSVFKKLMKNNHLV